MGGSRITWREPTQRGGECANSTQRRPRTSCCGATDKEMECMNEWMSKGFTVNTVHSSPRCRDTQLMPPLEPLRGLEPVDRIGPWKVMEVSLLPQFSPLPLSKILIRCDRQIHCIQKTLVVPNIKTLFPFAWSNCPIVIPADKLSAPSSVDHRWYLTFET